MLSASERSFIAEHEAKTKSRFTAIDELVTYAEEEAERATYELVRPINAKRISKEGLMGFYPVGVVKDRLHLWEGWFVRFPWDDLARVDLMWGFGNKTEVLVYDNSVMPYIERLARRYETLRLGSFAVEKVHWTEGLKEHCL